MDVDLVYTWVNSQDEAWLRQRHEHAAAETGDHSEYRLGESRFRDRDELRHSVMTARTFLPFVRTIYVVHAGQAADWLKGMKGVVCIADRDIVPDDIYPTYQSDLIEAHIHKISGLSEHYLYSNDDFFFASPHTVKDFFTDSGKCRIGITDRYASMGGLDAVYKHMEINAARALRDKVGHLSRIRVGQASLRNAADTRLKALKRGIDLVNTTSHVAQPYLRSQWKPFSSLFASELVRLSESRFRSTKGMTVNLLYHHYLRHRGLADLYLDPTHIYLDPRESLEKRHALLERFRKGDASMTRFCINDHAFGPEDPPGMEEAWLAYLEELKAAIRRRCGNGAKSADTLSRPATAAAIQPSQQRSPPAPRAARNPRLGSWKSPSGEFARS